jgi:phosphotransferase system IIB component
MEQFQIILIICGAALVLGLIGLAIGIFALRKKKKNNTPKIKVDDEFITNLIGLYGGNSNISSVVVDNGRLNITVNDLENVNLNGIKEIATNGVFVTGSTVKTLFRLDSELIKKAIENRL